MTNPTKNLIKRTADAALLGLTEHQVRSNIEASLEPALRAYDVLLAWVSGDVSEGRACELLKVDRTTLRAMRIQAVGRVTDDMDDPAIATKRSNAIDRMDAWVEEYATDRCSVSEGQTIRTFWKRARANEDFLQRLDDWRSLCPPGVALFSSDGDKG